MRCLTCPRDYLLHILLLFFFVFLFVFVYFYTFRPGSLTNYISDFTPLVLAVYPDVPPEGEGGSDIPQPGDIITEQEARDAGITITETITVSPSHPDVGMILVTGDGSTGTALAPGVIEDPGQGEGGEGGEGGGSCYTSAYSDIYTLPTTYGICYVIITHRAFDNTDGVIGGYASAAFGTTWHRLNVNDSDLSCKPNINLQFTNDWTNSIGTSYFKLTTTINSKDAGNSLGAGWNVILVNGAAVNGCDIQTCGNTSVSETQAVTDSGSATNNFPLLYCGDGACNCGENFFTCPDDNCPPPAPTCSSLSLVPSPIILAQGASSPLVASLQVTDTLSARIDFSFTSSGGTVSIDPASCTADGTGSISCGTTVAAVGVGSGSVNAKAYLENLAGETDGTFDCEANVPITITAPDDWFQTQEGDVHAKGNIRSVLPAASKVFSLNGSSSPGVVSFNKGKSSNFGGLGQISSTKWLAESDFTPKRSTYDYFYSKIGPTETFDCGYNKNQLEDLGSGFYLADGDCRLDRASQPVDWGQKKVVVFVNGDLIFPDNFKAITVTAGGFFAFIVRGNITIDRTIGTNNNNPFTGMNAHLQGVYLTDSNIDTHIVSTPGPATGNRLVIGGLFYGGSFNLDRDLTSTCTGNNICNANTPGELFIFRPDLVINSPKELWSSKVSWMEVAP